MTVRASMSKGTRVKATPAEGAIVAALRQLPPDYLTEVMRYIEFLQYKLDVAHGDAAEDEALWAAVEANQEYKRLHPDEDLEVYETGDAFLEAVKDL